MTRTSGGTIYLLHLSEPYGPGGGANGRGTAQHYTGVAFGGARGLKRRLGQHGTRQGSPLLRAARQAGITWVLARTWHGGRGRERQLKQQGGARRRCPLCGIQPRRVHADLMWNRDGSLSRLLTPDWQKMAVGVMTSAQLAEHTRLRKGAAAGRIIGIERRAGTPDDDPWYVMTVGAG
jgi:hypothetical protein